MESTHTPYIGSGRFVPEYSTGRPSAGTIYVWINYTEAALTGLYKSTDYGENWTQFMSLEDMVGETDFATLRVMVFNPTINDIGLCANDSYVFVAIRYGTTLQGIWRIPHGGGSSTKVHTGPTGSNAAKCSARIACDANGYVVQGMYSVSTFFDPVMAWSSDNGDNWIELKHLSDNTIEGVQRVKWLAVSGAEVLVMYNTASVTSLHRTTDANNGTGCTWTEILFGLGSPAGRCWDRFDISFSDLAISAQLQSNSKVLISDDYVTADAYVTDLLSAEGVLDLNSNYPRGYHPSDDKLFVITDDNKVWVLNGTHPPTGATHVGTLPIQFATYRNPSQDTGWIQWDDSDPTVMYALQEYNGIIRSADDGVTWYMKGALPTAYNGSPRYYIHDAMSDTSGTALGDHDPDADFSGGGWTVQSGAIEIESGKAVESTPGSESVATIEMSSSVLYRFAIQCDIEPADTLDLSIYMRWQDATHYLRLRLYSSGVSLYSILEYNNGAGDITASGPYEIGEMPTSKFRIIGLYCYTGYAYVFSVKLSGSSSFVKGCDAKVNYNPFSSEATVGFGFGATDDGSEVSEFNVIEPHQIFAEHWWNSGTSESIDGKVAGDYYGNAGPGTQVPGETWSVESGGIHKLTARSYSGVEATGGGTDGVAIVDDIGFADLFVEGFQFDPWSSASQFAGLCFRVQDGSNYLMMGVESLTFKLWKVVAGVATELDGESHSFSSSGWAYMCLWALGQHLCVWGYKSGNNPEVVADLNDTTFETEVGIGVYSGPNVTTGSNEIIHTGIVKKIEPSEFVESDGIYVKVADTDITDYVFSARSERGRDEELGHAAAGILEVMCDNYNGDFSPENSGGAFYGTIVLGAVLELYEIYGGVRYDHFTGKIDKIEPHPEPDNKIAYILAVDGMDDFEGSEIETVLRTDTDEEELLDDILDSVGDTEDRDFDEGIDDLQIGWFHEEMALPAIQDIESATLGFFLIDVDGTRIWQNRHYRILGDRLVSQFDFNENEIEIKYQWSKRDVKNWSRVTGSKWIDPYYGLPEEAWIWYAPANSASAPFVPANTTITLWAPLSGPRKTSDTLVKGTHWNANTSYDKSGTDVSDDITVTPTYYGQAIKFDIENAGNSDAYLVVPDSPPVGAPENATLLVYGTIYEEIQMSIVKEDTSSQSDYGKRTISVNARFKSNYNDLLAYAEWLIARYKDPVPSPIIARINAWTGYPDDTIKVQCLSLKISDRITIASTNLGIDGDYYIDKIIQEYVMYEGGTIHMTEYSLSRAAGQAELVYWLLGVTGFSELGQTTILGF